MHKLLERQLKRVLGVQSDEHLWTLLTNIAQLGDREGVPTDVAHAAGQLGQLLTRIDQSYDQFDRDLSLRARSLEVSSAELVVANERLRKEASAQGHAIRSLKETVKTLLGGDKELDEDSSSLEKLADAMKGLVGERQSAQAELERHKFAVDQHAIVSITDAAGNIVYANDKFCDISGFAREELLGKNHRIVKSDVHPKIFFDAMWGTLKRGRVWHGEICNKAKGGEQYWVSATIVPLLDDTGVPERYIAIRTDITLQKALEVELRTRRKFLQSMTNAMGEGVFVMDAEGYCTFLNPEAQRLLGYTVPELKGITMHDAIHHKDPDGNPLAREACRTTQALVRGETYRSDDEYFYRKDGQMIPVAIVAVPMREGDKIIGSVSVFQDVTERRRSVQALIAAKEEADRVSRLKSDFLANMSHEIRTPMNAVIGLNHLMSKTMLTPRQRDYSGKIDTASRSLLRIINDILDFSKIEAGKLSIEKIPFAMTNVIHELGTVVQPRAREKGLELILDQATDIPGELLGDPLRLGQVMLNLVSNAVKFTESGSVTIKVHGALGDNDVYMLEGNVTDTGIGLNESQIAELFKPFTQADTSTTRRFGGTGLGLAICKQLVELMGGDISVTSALGKGSTFSFRVPCPVVTSEPDSLPLPPHLQNLRVLVVDDSDAVRVILANMLEHFGLTVVSANGGLEALQQLEAVNSGNSEPFDLVVLDWRMPDMDGIETVRRIKEHVAPAPAIIMMTAYGVDSVQNALGDVNVTTVLEKPINPSTMFNAILNAMEKGRRLTTGIVVQEAEPTAMRGGRVLLVEDNTINQEVAFGLLDLLGIHVTIANNGEEGVELVKTGTFDAILMDVQMPKMDGLEATRHIRGELGIKDVPIIAMTAHAMAGDRQRSLEAGMNDHVTKPIEPAELHAALIRWMLPRMVEQGRASIRQTQSRPRISSPTSKNHHSVLPSEIPGIDLVSAKKHVSGNLELLRKVLIDFGRTLPDSVKNLSAAAKAGNFSEVFRIAHTLKGTAATVGAVDVATIAAKLEEMGAKGGGAKIEGVMEALDQAVEIVTSGTDLLNEKEPVLVAAATDSSGPPAPRADAVASALLLVIRAKELFASGDPDSSDVADSIADLLRGTTAQKHGDLVARHASNFDFDDATKALVALEQTLSDLAGSPS